MKVFFDTCAWIDIIHDKLTNADLLCLRGKVKNGECSIYISTYVFEELIPEKQHDPTRFGDHTALICECVEDNLLLPYNLRMILEIFYNRALNVQESLMRKIVHNGLFQHVMNMDSTDILSKVKADKSDFKHGKAEGYSNAREYIVKNHTRSDHAIYIQEKRRRIGEETAEYFFSHWCRIFKRKSCRSLPTNWAYFAFEIARQTLAFAPEVSRRRCDSLDDSSYDQIVFADAFGLGCDFLVTEDRILVEIVKILSEVDERTPKVVGLKDFLRELCRS